MNEIVELPAFQNGEFQLHLRQHGDGFVVHASDLAEALGIRDGYTLVRSIPDNEKLTVDVTNQLGRPQQAWFVTEPGFYRALGQRQAARVSDDDIREKVERFQRWVYGEVLPGIRRNGWYGEVRTTEQTVTAAPDLLELAHIAKARIEAVNAAAQNPAADHGHMGWVIKAILRQMDPQPGARIRRTQDGRRGRDPRRGIRTEQRPIPPPRRPRHGRRRHPVTALRRLTFRLVCMVCGSITHGTADCSHNWDCTGSTR